MKESNRNALPMLCGGVLLLLILVWLQGSGRIGLWMQLPAVVPFFLTLNVIIIAVGIVINWGEFRVFISGISPGMKRILLTVAIAGFLLAAFVAPRTHRLFYDEFIYENIGQSIAYAGRAVLANEADFEYGEYRLSAWEYNKQPNAYPYLLSLLYKFFGIKDIYAFFLNNVLFVFAVFTVFALGYLLFNNSWAGLYAALIYALIPQNLIWANTASSEVSSAFFAALSLSLLVLFIRSGNSKMLFLATAITAYACQFRPESIFVPILGLLALFLLKPEEIKGYRLRWAGVLLLFLLTAHLGHMALVRDQNWGSPGDKFSLPYFLENIKVNGLFYFDNERFPLFFTALALFGLFSGKDWRSRLLLAVWFLLFWGVFLFFYAGSYNYGCDVRFSLLSYAPLAILAGAGLDSGLRTFFESFKIKRPPEDFLRKTSIALLILAFVHFLPLVRAVTREAWDSRNDYKFAKIFMNFLPPNSIVLTHNPSIFLLHGKNAAQLSTVKFNKAHLDNDLFEAYKGGVYMHWGFWCVVPDPAQNAFGKYVLENYKCTVIESRSEHGYDYKLYRIEKKS